MRQVLFVQGGGGGAHDEWDARLVASLARELGAEWDVRYPRMPEETEPSYASWGPCLRRELAAVNEGAVVVAHSVGGTLLVQTLVDRPPSRRLSAVVLIAAPFVGLEGWPSDEFEFSEELGGRLPRGTGVHVVHGLDDDTVPVAHANLYARAVPQAHVHLLAGRDHQLNDDLSVIARTLEERPEHDGPLD